MHQSIAKFRPTIIGLVLPAVELVDDQPSEACIEFRSSCTSSFPHIKLQLERKIVSNASARIEKSDNAPTINRKIADCLNEATGLTVSFEAFGLKRP